MYTHIVLDANAFIASVPSSLHSLSRHHWTVSSVLHEIKDPRARASLATLPFDLTTRAPSEESISAVRAFAGKTGDLRTLSRTDIAVLALARQLEVESNGTQFVRTEPPTNTTLAGAPQGVVKHLQAVEGSSAPGAGGAAPPATGGGGLAGWGEGEDDEGEWQGPAEPGDAPIVEEAKEGGGKAPSATAPAPALAASAPAPAPASARVPVGVITSDFAMQNVALQMGLNLLTPGGKSIVSVKSWVLKCDACFTIFPMHGLRPEHTLFCAKCGNATLARLGVTLGSDGAPRYHYKRFRQVNTRGTIFPIPDAKGGRVEKGGGGGGRGSTDLLLRPDQLLMGGWKEKLRHAAGAEAALDEAEGPGGEGGSSSGWGRGAWAAPTAASLAAPMPFVEVGYGRRNPNAAKRKSGKR